MLRLMSRTVSDADVVALEQAKNNVNFKFTINPLIQHTLISLKVVAARRWSRAS